MNPGWGDEKWLRKSGDFITKAHNDVSNWYC